jgi:Insulinase (Peptidase family M16)
LIFDFRICFFFYFQKKIIFVEMMLARQGYRKLRGIHKEGGVPSYLTNRPATRITTLDNGLRVATESNLSETASIGVYINAGSAYETTETNGAAHFLEHLIFVCWRARARQQETRVLSGKKKMDLSEKKKEKKNR